MNCSAHIIAANDVQSERLLFHRSVAGSTGVAAQCRPVGVPGYGNHHSRPLAQRERSGRLASDSRRVHPLVTFCQDNVRGLIEALQETLHAQPFALSAYVLRGLPKLMHVL